MLRWFRNKQVWGAYTATWCMRACQCSQVIIPAPVSRKTIFDPWDPVSEKLFDGWSMRPIQPTCACPGTFTQTHSHRGTHTHCWHTLTHADTRKRPTPSKPEACCCYLLPFHRAKSGASDGVRLHKWTRSSRFVNPPVAEWPSSWLFIVGDQG